WQRREHLVAVRGGFDAAGEFALAGVLHLLVQRAPPPAVGGGGGGGRGGPASDRASVARRRTSPLRSSSRRLRAERADSDAGTARSARWARAAKAFGSPRPRPSLAARRPSPTSSATCQ